MDSLDSSIGHLTRQLLAAKADEKTCHEHPPSIDEIMDNLPDWLPPMYIVGAIMCFLTCVISGANLIAHYVKGLQEAKYTVFIPAHRAAAMVIIGMAPLYSCTSYIGIWLPNVSHIVELTHSFYEAICLATFFYLMLYMLRGPVNALKLFEDSPPTRFKGLPPFCCCWTCCPKQHLDGPTLTLAKWTVLQFIILKPLVYIFQLGLEVNGYDYHNSAKGFAAFNVIQTFICMYGLFMLYMAATPVCPEFKFGAKFVIIKAVIVLAVLQRYVLRFAIPVRSCEDLFSSEQEGEIWNNFIFCLEFLPISIAGYRAFPVHEMDHIVLELQGGDDVEMQPIAVECDDEVGDPKQPLQNNYV